MMSSLFLAGGLALLYIGAEALVRGGSALALRLGIAPLIVGLTVVAFGTSTPEMVVSVGAALAGNSDISMGNIVGSNICNIGLILGLAAMIQPMKVQVQLVRFDVPIMIATSVVLVVLVADGGLDRIDGFMLCIAMATYMWFLIVGARKDRNAMAEAMTDTIHATSIPMGRAILMVFVGLGLLVLGGKFFVDGAVSLAERFGISERVIGLTVVAVGTSMPELATSIVAAVKREADISIGNVVGSNIFNILWILGVTGLIRPITTAGFSMVDYAVMIGFAIALFPLARFGFELSRWKGALLLAGYVAYLTYLAR
jgi:cation:H+ antiporter